MPGLFTVKDEKERFVGSKRSFHGKQGMVHGFGLTLGVCVLKNNVNRYVWELFVWMT